jgi:two-component system OmpR family sensor kinase
VGVQLSIIYALLVAATLALLGWVLYAQLEGFMVKNTAERLESFTQPTLLRNFPQRGERGGPPLIDTGQSGSYQEQVATSLLYELKRDRPDVDLVVMDAQGSVVTSSLTLANSSFGGAGSIPGEWAQLVSSNSIKQRAQWIAPNADNERQLVVLTPLTARTRDGELLLYLEQITSLRDVDATLGQLRLYIILGILIGTAIGVVAGLALTRAVLRPLDRMVRTAEAIAGGDIDRRLRLPAGNNEVARLGSAFDHMVDRLGSALDAQKRFVADASHELRTPLTSMEGLSEMLLMGADRGDTKVVQRTVRSIHGELGRLGRLVSDLLTLSRLDSTVPLRRQSVDLGNLLVEVADQMRPLADARLVSLLVSAPPDVAAMGEPDRLKQVVLNLTDNAIRYTPEGGEVRLTAAVEQSAGQVRIEVQDMGPGIPAQDLPHIFDRFYRGDISRARSTGNTGLGLAIARAIVEAHSGTISAESVPGKGATFRVVLPTDRQSEAPPRRQSLAARRVKTQTASEPSAPQHMP